MPRWYKVFKIILILVPVIFFIFLVCQDLVVSGRLEAAYNFSEPSPFVMPLAPKARISEVKKESSDYYQTMFDDPIYFDVRLPRKFSTITFWAKFRPTAGQTVRLAAFNNKDQWNFEAKDFFQVEDLGDGWYLGSVDFDMSAKRFAFQKYQFMVSLPGIRGSGRTVDISEIKMLSQREPMTLGIFWQKLKAKIFN
ncbi:MAG: hypothetical protein WC310_03625 [Patescibacteria group bacterium]|jgi:hypothetical protein